MKTQKLGYASTARQLRTRTRLSVWISAALLTVSSLSLALVVLSISGMELGGEIPEGSFLLCWGASAAGAAVACGAIIAGQRQTRVWLLLGIGIAECTAATLWFLCVAVPAGIGGK